MRQILALIQAGLADVETQAWDKAAEKFKSATQKFPQHPVSYFFLSLCELAKGNGTGAEASVKQGLERSPNNLLGKNLSALTELRQGKTKAALEKLQEDGLAENPDVQAFLLLELEKWRSASQ